MATAYIEGLLTGHWGTDQATLHRWSAWGGYRYSTVRNLSRGTVKLAVKGDTAPAPAPDQFGPPPAALPHELVT